jgi:hypothetical protein
MCRWGGGGSHSRDELEIVLDVHTTLLLFKCRPAATRHAQPPASQVQVPQHASCGSAQHLHVAHQILAVPVEVQHLAIASVPMVTAGGSFSVLQLAAVCGKPTLGWTLSPLEQLRVVCTSFAIKGRSVGVSQRGRAH